VTIALYKFAFTTPYHTNTLQRSDCPKYSKQFCPSVWRGHVPVARLLGLYPPPVAPVASFARRPKVTACYAYATGYIHT